MTTKRQAAPTQGRLAWLGANVDYEEAWELQRRIAGLRAAGDAPDTLLLLEHAPVYTAGRRSPPEHIVGDLGFPLVETDRGGLVTYHGPGQLVGYPIVDLTVLGRGPESLRAGDRDRGRTGVGVLRPRRPRRGGADRRVDEPREDRRDRRAYRTRRLDARLRVERAHRPCRVRAHRTVRHSRPARDVGGAGVGLSAVRRGDGPRGGETPRRAARRHVARGQGYCSYELCGGKSICRTVGCYRGRQRQGSSWAPRAAGLPALSSAGGTSRAWRKETSEG